MGMFHWNAHLRGRERMGLSSHLLPLKASLHDLARHLQTGSDLEDARAVYGDVGFIPAGDLERAARYAGRLGFELRPGKQPRWNCFRRSFWRNALSWWLLRRFNPDRSRQLGFGRMRRCELWISRDELIARYGQ